MKRIWIIGAIAAVVVLMGLKLAGNKHKIDEKKKVTIDANVQIPVNVARATMDTLTEKLVKTGTLLPWQEAAVSATAAGNLTRVAFMQGSNVSKGMVMAEVDSRLLQLRLEAAQLQQQKLQRDYERFSVLLKGDATTENNVQDIKYNLDNATNQIAQIKKQLADNQIKAPISGQVTEKRVENGEYVNPGTILANIVDISRLKVDVKVSEQDAYKVHKGQQVNITTDLYPGQTFTGEVLFVNAQGDATHNYQIQISLNNTQAHPLKAGTFVYADFVTSSQRPVLQIPRSALAESLKDPYVYVVEDGKAKRRAITTGKETGANIEVIDGLKEGDEIIVNGQINITDGSAVRIME